MKTTTVMLSVVIVFGGPVIAASVAVDAGVAIRAAESGSYVLEVVAVNPATANFGMARR